MQRDKITPAGKVESFEGIGDCAQATSEKGSIPPYERLRPVASGRQTRYAQTADARTDQRFSRRRNLTKQAASSGLPWPLIIFLAGLINPWIIAMGPMSLSVYRIPLLIMVLPCLFMWASGRAGPIRFADVAVILFSLWASLSLAVAHGVNGIQSIGIQNVETLGGYFLARCYVRTADDFRRVVQFVSKLIMVILPFSLYEWITGGKPLLTIFGLVFPTVDITMMEPRWGLWRVQGPFGHSIVYGLFCGSLVGLAYMVLGYGKSGLARWARPAIVGLATFVSMSSAPIAGVALQIALILWNWVLRRFKWRWKLLWGAVFMGYLVVEFGSTQTPVAFYISHFTFDRQTGWYRMLIWEYGSATVAGHPLLGIGFGDWARLGSMVSSVDNFWLLMAMRHGVPALVLIFGACLAVICGAAWKNGLDERTDVYRTGYVICMVMFLLVGCTVHFWGAIYAWFIFLLGSGVWIMDVKPDGVDTGRSRHPRFQARKNTTASLRSNSGEP